MADSSEEVKTSPPQPIEIPTSIEVELPQVQTPQSVEISTPPLTGNVQSSNIQDNQLMADASNYKFVVGPDGQMVAIHKPPFVWKDFYIGFGVPFAIFFLPILLLAIVDPFYDDYQGYEDEVLELTKTENSTQYTGNLQFEEPFRLGGCSIWIDSPNEEFRSAYYYCENWGDNATIFFVDDYGNSSEVGEWNNSLGLISFDTGEDFGENSTVNLEYSFYNSDEEWTLEDTLRDSLGFTCLLGIISSVVMAVSGFAKSKPGQGWGGCLGILISPVAAIISILFSW